ASVLVFVLAAAGFLSAVTTIRIAIRGRIVSMPNLVGQPAPEAQRMLATRGLQLRVADRVYSPLPVNAVVRQSPPAGEEMKISQDAHVVLSLGQQEASRTLAAAGLKIAKLNHIAQAGAPKGTIVGQNPPGGERIPGDTTVELGVAE